MQNVGPEAMRGGKYRFLRSGAPLVFSTVDPHALYLGANVLFKTTNGGQSWDIISPDLSREAPEVPSSIGIFRTPQLAERPDRGVIYTVAPSYKDADVIWCGSDGVDDAAARLASWRAEVPCSKALRELPAKDQMIMSQLWPPLVVLNKTLAPK